MQEGIFVIEADKIGSATSPLGLSKTLLATDRPAAPKVGDVIVARALGESASYGNLELPSGRLAKINRNDILLCVLGKRRALKGFFGDIPKSLSKGDSLHILNMGGLAGICSGHHSSLSDAIPLEFLGSACDENGRILSICDTSLPPASKIERDIPLVVVAGTCMNSGKTVAAVEIIKQATHSGLKVSGAKLTGVACLRDTLNMEDHGAVETASFLDCGLPSTVGIENLASVAKSIINRLGENNPDLIVVELGDGIVGGYSVDSILRDAEIRCATSAFVFCASDYVGVIGGMAVLNSYGIGIDVVAGSVTDSLPGEEFVEREFGIPAGNARRDGERLFRLLNISRKKEIALL